jgi:hypothetical protein
MAAPFPANIVKDAFIRSDGECECTRNNHKHSGRCNNLVIYNMKGLDLPGGWEAYHVDADKPAVINNCQIFCLDCFKTF